MAKRALTYVALAFVVIWLLAAPPGVASSPSPSLLGKWQQIPVSCSKVSCWNDLNSIYMLNASEGWAVGSGGLILHYRDDVWTDESVPQVTIESLQAVHALSSSQVWIASDDHVLRKAGGGWLVEDLPEFVHYYNVTTIQMLSSTDGWIAAAAASGSSILHYNGASWLPVTGTVGYDLYDLEMVSPTEGWAVGGYRDEEHILHYSAGSWTEITSPTSNGLYSLDMVSASEGWAVGYDGTILHYTGGAWNYLTPKLTTYSLNAVSMGSSEDGWAIGDGIALRYTGGSWSIVSDFTWSGVNAVQMLSDKEGWAVGDYSYWGHGTWCPLVLRYSLWWQTYLPYIAK